MHREAWPLSGFSLIESSYIEKVVGLSCMFLDICEGKVTYSNLDEELCL